MRNASPSSMRFLQHFFIALAVAGAFVAAGCIGRSSSSTPQISITLSPSATQTLDQGKTLSVTATVANDTSSQGVTWSLTGTGTLTGSTSTGTTYNAPGSVTAASTATLTATSKADTTKTATLTINLVLPPTVTTASLSAGTVGIAYSATLVATGGAQPYTWSVTVGTLPAGLSLDPSTGAITGIPTITGTSNFTVQVKDSMNVTATSALSITINSASSGCPSGSESKLNGQYAFQMQGFDANGPVAISGSFDADGAGHIGTTVGVVDINRSSGVQTNLLIDSPNSSYSVGSDNRGCLTIATSAGTSVFRISLGKFTSNVAGQGHLIEFDSSGTLGSGVIEQQNSIAFSTAQINGNYAFGISSTLSLTTRSRFGAVGSFLASAGVITAGALDTNDSGNVDNSGTNTVPASPESFTGTYSVSSNGRGTLTLNTGGSTPVNASLYVVSAQKILIMSIDSQAVNGLFAGTVLQQSGSAFSNASLNATSVLLANGITGATPPTSDVLIGLLSIPSSGNFSLSADENDGATTASVAISGTYSVDSTTGRVTTTASGANHPPIFYLVSANEGFLLGSDNSVTTGFFELQTGGPFGPSSADGSYFYGSGAPMTPNVLYESGVTSLNTGNISGTTDSNSLGSGLSGNQGFTTTYSIASTGRGTTAGGDIFYIISPTKIVRIRFQPGNTTVVEAMQ